MWKAKKLKTFFSFRRVDLFKRLISSFFLLLHCHCRCCCAPCFDFNFGLHEPNLLPSSTELISRLGTAKYAHGISLTWAWISQRKSGFEKWLMVATRNSAAPCCATNNEVPFLRAEFNFRWVKYWKWSGKKFDVDLWSFCNQRFAAFAGRSDRLASTTFQLELAGKW